VVLLGGGNDGWRVRFTRREVTGTVCATSGSDDRCCRIELRTDTDSGDVESAATPK